MVEVTQRARAALSLARQKIEPHVRIDSLTNDEVDMLADAVLDVCRADADRLVEAIDIERERGVKLAGMLHYIADTSEDEHVARKARQAIAVYEGKQA